MFSRIATTWIALLAALAAVAEVSSDPPTPPARARVVIAQDPGATVAFVPNATIVRQLVERGLKELTGKPTVNEAWRSLVSAEDVVGFKVCAGPGNVSGSRPAVVGALVDSLLAAGQPPGKIVIWDKHLHDLRQAGWIAFAGERGIRTASSAEAGWDSEKFYETALLGRLVAGDLEFEKRHEGAGRRSFVSRLLTQQLTKIIHVAPVLSHNLAGVNGLLYGLAFGSVDNTLRFTDSATRLGEAVPEIYVLPELSERVVLNVSDALICQFRGDEGPRLHYATALNELRFSRDPVALDALALADVNRAREAGQNDGEKPFKTELYRNAALLELGVADLKEIDIRHAP